MAADNSLPTRLRGMFDDPFACWTVVAFVTLLLFRMQLVLLAAAVPLVAYFLLGFPSAQPANQEQPSPSEETSQQGAESRPKSRAAAAADEDDDLSDLDDEDAEDARVQPAGREAKGGGGGGASGLAGSTDDLDQLLGDGMMGEDPYGSNFWSSSTKANEPGPRPKAQSAVPKAAASRAPAFGAGSLDEDPLADALGDGLDDILGMSDLAPKRGAAAGGLGAGGLGGGAGLLDGLLGEDGGDDMFGFGSSFGGGKGSRDKGKGKGKSKDKDRGKGKDRFGDRDRYGGDRDRGGFGGDRDRGGFGGDRGCLGDDRDSYGGDRDRGGGDRERFGGDRDRYGGGRDDGGRPRRNGFGDEGYRDSRPRDEPERHTLGQDRDRQQQRPSAPEEPRTELDDILDEALEEEAGPLRPADFDANSKRFLTELMTRDRKKGTHRGVDCLEKVFKAARDAPSGAKWPVFIYSFMQKYDPELSSELNERELERRFQERLAQRAK